jgi:S-formylglutathione hydrolase FrmB
VCVCVWWVLSLMPNTQESMSALARPYTLTHSLTLFVVFGGTAYINDRHVVGRVQRKEAARRTYREAVARGDGAYMMEENVPVLVLTHPPTATHTHRRPS